MFRRSQDGTLQELKIQNKKETEKLTTFIKK